MLFGVITMAHGVMVITTIIRTKAGFKKSPSG
jgi:hypothetical protein